MGKTAEGKFKVGDRVRWTRCDNKYQSAEVTENDTNMFDYRIAEDHDYTYAYEHELVAVAAQQQLTIRAGRYYKTRDGRKVGPMERNGSGQYYWLSSDDRDGLGGYMAFWCEDGAYYPYRKDFHLDLIAEWVDEPAVAETKFKVGDLVHYKDHICEGVGVITEPNGDGDWFVEVEEHDREWAPFDNMTTRVFDSGDLRLVAPATSGKKPSIVALIENDQPKPATRPFVHHDRESAAKEARRLAGKHKGQEFGVYELVDTAKEAKVYEHEWQRLAAAGETYHARKELQRTGITGIQASRIVQEFVAAA